MGLRLYPDVEVALDAWIADQTGTVPSRLEAIRIILAKHLKAKGYLK